MYALGRTFVDAGNNIGGSRQVNFERAIATIKAAA